jgi:hypothetical protein
MNIEKKETEIELHTQVTVHGTFGDKKEGQKRNGVVGNVKILTFFISSNNKVFLDFLVLSCDSLIGRYQRFG